MVSDDADGGDTADSDAVGDAPDDGTDGAVADIGAATESDEEWEPEEPTRVDEDTIVVPMRMYKGITVFSTLLATLLVVFGFFMFDAATQPQNLVRQAVVWVFGTVGVVPPAGVFDVAFGLLGVALILTGAGSYILGSRFKTSGMLSEEDTPEEEVAEE